MKQPKILIVSRLVWDDASSSNTLTNLFEDYDSDKISRIYIESKQPNTKCCHRFYQISEISLVQKLYKWGLKTGREIDTRTPIESTTEQATTQNLEDATMSFVRSHRSWLFSIAREILWYFNGWKTKELEQFIRDTNPDVVWLDGSPLILMNRLNNYVLKVANKPAVTFLMDDVYNYKSCTGWVDKIFKFFLRKHVKRTIGLCKHVFVSSPKMKEEYDKTFGINSMFIAKSCDTSRIGAKSDTVNTPLRMVYLGNVLIGRLDSLIYLAEAIQKINNIGRKIDLDIYTTSYISDADKKRLIIDDGIRLFPPVAYSEIPQIINDSDVQVFVESLDAKNMSVARLSFSTKIVDYLISGKCILAIGPNDVAPIEYFKQEDAGLVATTKSEIYDCLQKLLDKRVVKEYAQKAVSCAQRNHDRRGMNKRIYTTLCNVADQA